MPRCCWWPQRRPIEIPEPQRQSQSDFLAAELANRGHGLPNALSLLLEFVNVNGDFKGMISTERVGIHDLGWKSPALVFLPGSQIILALDQLAKEDLRNYLNGGGLLYAAAINEGSSGTFYQQVWELVEEPFPSSPGFRPMGPEHEILMSYYEFGDGPPQERSTRWRRRRPSSMEVFDLRGHTVAILSDLNLIVAWADPEEENHLRALQFGTNLVVYAMTNRMRGQLR